MPKLETPEEFRDKIGRLGYNVIEYADITAEDKLLCAITARDAAIRAESAELLRVCGEALKAVCDDLPMNSVRSAVLSRAALAALKEAGVING